MSFDIHWKSQAQSPADALKLIQSGMKIFIHGATATPTPLLDALCEETKAENISLYHLHTSGPHKFAEPQHRNRFYSTSLFAGAPVRKLIEEGLADFIPVFLSDIPALFTNKTIPLDVALVQLSPPDRHGFCTLGTSVDAAKAATDAATFIIAEINEQMPRTHGNTVVNFSDIDAFVLTNRPLIEGKAPEETTTDGQIGAIIADLVEDGSTLQVGIGGIPNAVLKRLKTKNDLGLHTEMFSDGIIDLVEAGNITNKYKKLQTGRCTTSFINGTRRLFDFVNDNPKVEFHPCNWTNDTARIRQNDKVVAINSALEIDLSGQVCADSIGYRIYSGIGGQMDFIHGAALSRGGKPIIAIPSTAVGGKLSRIVPALKPGAGVVTTRGHVHWVVTEYGAVNLHGLPLKARAERLASIAHPDFRAELLKEIRGIHHW